jgi:predicted TIM-barrel fold metal-dependent hydrolase
MARVPDGRARDDPGATPRIALEDYRPRAAVRLPSTPRRRPASPAIDAHNHLGRWLTSWVRPGGGWMVEDVGALLELMDGLDIEMIVNLDGRFGDELEANLERYDRAHPDRFVTFCHVDWGALAGPRGTRALLASLERSSAAGARGLKVWKDLGLGIRDASGELVLPDDERAAPVFAAAGELGLPVLIHTADPVAFFAPLDARNERLEELSRHPEWSFCGPGFPSFDRLMEALEGVVAAHPRTTFIAAHVGCYAEDLAWVGRMLDSYPNLLIDISARISELGRQPRAARELIVRHHDRVLFGTDEFPPSRAQYETYFRVLETADECFPYSPDPADPWPRGRWSISALDLPQDVLGAVYRGNASRLFARAAPVRDDRRPMP